MDHSVGDQNSSNRRLTRTLPSWLAASTSTSGTQSQKNRWNDTSNNVITSSPVTVKTEFTECDDDMSLFSSIDPEPIDVKPKIEDISCSSTIPEPVDIKPNIENLPLSSSTNPEPVDVKPEVMDLPSCSLTKSEPADVKPKIEEIPIETVFVQEDDDTEFMREDSATTVGTADSTNVDDYALGAGSTEPPKEDRTRSSTPPQSSPSNIPSSVVSSPSALPTSTDTSLPTGRRMCIYRHKCYRANPQHKIDFSHPGDVDYDGEPECDSTSGDSPSKPRCWYGSNCYRRSEEHRQKFRHSPPNPRKRNATQVNRRNTNNDDADSDAYDDSFIDDNSEDDFVGTEDEETEFSDFDSASSSDEDSYRGIGRSKKKKFNIL